MKATDNKTKAVAIPSLPGGAIRNYDSMGQLLTDAKALVAASSASTEKPGDVAMKLEAALSLNIPMAFAMSNFHVIKNRLSAGYKIIAGLVLRAGHRIEIVENYVEVMHFKMLGGFTVSFSRKEWEENKDKYHLYILDAEGNITNPDVPEGKTPILKFNRPEIWWDDTPDRRTTIKVTRQVRLGDGSIQRTENVDSYYLHEAFNAGYFGQLENLGTGAKDNWVGNTKVMMLSKAIPRACVITVDAYMGMIPLEDMLDNLGASYTIDGEGNTTFDSSMFDEPELEE
jgi:hypothetical protein